jgi:hypothetical protein
MTFQQLWRQVETGDVDMLEFCRGGGTPLVRQGWFSIFAGAFLFFWGLVNASLTWRLFLAGIQSGDYSGAAFVYVAEGLLFLFIFEQFLIGVWLVYGRTHVLLDRKTASITKEHRLRSCCLFSKTYRVENSSSFTFRRQPRSWFFLHVLCLHQEANRRIWLLAFPRWFHEEGWIMAEKMAAFMGIPLIPR